MNMIFVVMNTWDTIWILRYIQLSSAQQLHFIIYVIDQNNQNFTGKNSLAELLMNYILIDI